MLSTVQSGLASGSVEVVLRGAQVRGREGTGEVVLRGAQVRGREGTGEGRWCTGEGGGGHRGGAH